LITGRGSLQSFRFDAAVVRADFFVAGAGAKRATIITPRALVRTSSRTRGLHIAGEGASWARRPAVRRGLPAFVGSLSVHAGKFFLQSYPIMKGSGAFYADLLIEEPKHHWLVIRREFAKMVSHGDGRRWVCMGPTVAANGSLSVWSVHRIVKILGVDGISEMN